MAELCLDCWNKINNSQDSRLRYVMSWEKEYCEECGEWKRVIVVKRLWSCCQRALEEAIENLRSNNSDKE